MENFFELALLRILFFLSKLGFKYLISYLKNRYSARLIKEPNIIGFCLEKKMYHQKTHPFN